MTSRAITGKLTVAQQTARVEILTFINGNDGWSSWHTLHNRGFNFQQVMACVRRGDLTQPTRGYRYEITPAGRLALKETRA